MFAHRHDGIGRFARNHPVLFIVLFTSKPRLYRRETIRQEVCEVGIMPNDRNQRLESALRRFGIPGAQPQSDRKNDRTELASDGIPDLPGAAPDPRKRIPMGKGKRA